MGLTVGIDLGTTYSVVAYIDPVTKTPVIINNKYGLKTTPSVVAFKKDGSVLIGLDAKKCAESGDCTNGVRANTAAFYKLEMGSKSYRVSFFGQDYTATDLSAVFLKELIRQCEETVGQRIDKAVITVPAYFEDLERNNTIKAGTSAGLNVINVINEPTAAAIAYGLRENDTIGRILVYDLGGGTFDVTIAHLGGDSVEVIGSAGNHFLGGKNWDEVICNYICECFEDEFGVSPADDTDTYNSLMVKAERAKQLLSSSPYADITVIYEDFTGRYRLTEELFRELSADLLNITKKTIDGLFEDIGLSWADIGGVILVGGSTKMKMVGDYITQMTGKEPLRGVNPDEAVAIGAAIQAGTDDYCAVKTLASAAAPKAKLGFLTSFDRSAYDMKQLKGAKFISDVIAHSLGMISVSADGSCFVNDIMIKKNTPISKAEIVKRRELKVSRLAERNELEIYLLQGDCEKPTDCTVAKKYVFSDIRYIDGGKTMLDITYSYTLNGTIDIKAVQLETGRELTRREEPVPDDMSWADLPPAEFTELENRLTGALYMAIDLSGSMDGNPLWLAQEAMKSFVDQFDVGRIKIGIVGFANKAKVWLEATSDLERIRNSIDRVDKLDLGAGTTAEPLSLILSHMKKFKNEPFKYAVILTDGGWYQGADKKALKLKAEFVRRGIEIVGLGFGNARLDFLKKLSTREDLASVDDISMLDSNLLKIARIIQE